MKPGPDAGWGGRRMFPLKFGITRETYLAEFERALSRAVEQCRPQLILLSAGFDAHREDPVGSLGLEVEDFGTLTQMVVDASTITAAAGSSACSKAATTSIDWPNRSNCTSRRWLRRTSRHSGIRIQISDC